MSLASSLTLICNNQFLKVLYTGIDFQYEVSIQINKKTYKQTCKQKTKYQKIKRKSCCYGDTLFVLPSVERKPDGCTLRSAYLINAVHKYKSNKTQKKYDIPWKEMDKKFACYISSRFFCSFSVCVWVDVGIWALWWSSNCFHCRLSCEEQK